MQRLIVKTMLATTAGCLALTMTPAKAGEPNGQSKNAQAAVTLKAKPLSEQTQKALKWLAVTQLASGGWSQGDESAEMGNASNRIANVANVADTSMAALALIRAGSTPGHGPYAKNVRNAVDFVCAAIEKSDEKSLRVASLEGTRLQSKLGPYIDTFMASMLLAEVRKQMPDAAAQKRVAAAFDKVMDKIEKNQRADGTWDSQGWAPVLSQSMASKALNRAAQNGAKVDEKVRARAETYARGQFDKKSGGFKGEGSASVPLYSSAGNLGAIQDSANTNSERANEARKVAASPATTAPQKAQAQRELKRYAENDSDLAVAKSSIIKQLDDKSFVSGFGSNGGEEFLSYMNIGESLAVKGGAEWDKWEKSMTANLNRIQNADGTWSGHHCITGRTFCTAAALMTLTVDRAPVPLAAKIKRR